LFKDAHCEALKKEVSRLRQLYHEQQQLLQKEIHASSTGAYDLQQHQFGHNAYWFSNPPCWYHEDNKLYGDRAKA
ncbi:hypothetical protein KI387_027795, partial [Taxus chinensis]